MEDRDVRGIVPPLISLSILYAAGYCAGGFVGRWPLADYVPAPARVLVVAVALLAAGVFTAAVKRGLKMRLFCLSLVLAGFFFNGLARGLFAQEESETARQRLQSYSGTDATVCGLVTGFPSELAGGTRFALDLHGLKSESGGEIWEGRKPRVLATVRPAVDVRYGDLLRITGRLDLPTGPRNPGGFDYKAYLCAKGVHGTFRGRSPRVRLAGEGYGYPALAYGVDPVRRGVGDLFDRRVGGKTKALLRGLLLGDRALVAREVRESMVRAGVIHVMAVSGLHVGIVALILVWVARCMGAGPATSAYATMAGVLVYCAVVGFPASACRACLMVVSYILCRRLQRAGAPFGSLALAAFVLTILRPAWITTPGFQLSFAAAGGVLAFKDCLKGLGRWGRAERIPGLSSVLTLLGASLGASAATWPLLLYHFGRTPLLFLLGNLFAVPLVGIILAWGLAAMAVGAVSPGVSDLLLAACWAAGVTLLMGCDIVASIPWASAATGPVEPVFVGLYLVALCLAFRSRGLKRSAAAGGVFVLSALLLFVPGVRRAPGSLEATFLDVGHGDACVFLLPTGECMLVDAGAAGKNWNAGRDVLVPFLRSKCVRSVDRVVISHGDGDHWGGLEELARQINLTEIVLAKDVPLGGLGDLALELSKRGAALRWATAGDTLQPLGGLECVVLHPSADFERQWGPELNQELNDRSLVLSATYGNATFLMTGDVERAAESWLATKGLPLRCAVVKVPHHGSNTSNSAEFLSLVSPRVAVFSCGPRERFNLPKPEILARYDSLGAFSMQTVRDGAVVVSTDGIRLRVRSYVDPERGVEFDL